MATPTADDFKALISDPTAKLCGNFVNTLLKLPVTLYNWIKAITAPDGSINGVAQVGDYIFSASPLTETDLRKLCNGQELRQVDFPELYSVIGDTYGTATVAGNFKLPDFTARFPIGVGQSTGGITVLLAGKGGEETHELLPAELPSHTHTFKTWEDGTSIADVPDSGHDVVIMDKPTARPGKTTQDVPTSATGGTGTPVATEAHNNMPPWLGVVIYIRVK